jgi:hypothetical protein
VNAFKKGEPMKKIIGYSLLVSGLMLTGAAVLAEDSSLSTGYVFSGEKGQLAKLACSSKLKKCIVKFDKVSKEYDGKMLLLYADESGSELHLSTKKDRIATLYTDGGRARELTFWLTSDKKRMDLKVNDAKTEAFDPKAFFKAGMAEQP